MLQIIRENIEGLSKMQMIGLGCLLVIIVCKVLHMCCFKKETFSNRDSGNNSGENGLIFRMFYVNWCGHCKVAKPEFINFSENNKDVSTEMIDAEDEKNADIVAAHEIDGYPTFILSKNGEDTVYTGERTEAGFKEFIDENK